MADNYLEKKFEEHFAAANKPAKRHTPVRERRAVVIGGASGTGAAIVRALRVAGNKVSFCDTDKDSGAETALRNGAEFKHLEAMTGRGMDEYLQDVLTRWKGIDIIVCHTDMDEQADDAPCDGMAECATKIMAQSRTESHSEYGRLIRVINTTGDAYPTLAAATRDLSSRLAESNVSVSTIITKENAPLPIETARMVRFIIDEGNEFMNGKCLDLR